MTPVPIRTRCVDASALVRNYVKEDFSDEVRGYLKGHPDWYTTQFAFFEALRVLKRKRFSENKITVDEYHEAGRRLIRDFEARLRDVPGIESFPFVLANMESLCRKYDLDFSDAFQILSVKGKASALWSGAELITADRPLALAAKR